MYDLYILRFVWYFEKLYFLSFNEIKFDFVTWVFYNEIDNDLFNRYISYLINFIIKLKILINWEEFDFLEKIDNNYRVTNVKRVLWFYFIYMLNR
jgi:hypothetical protein